MKNSSEPIKSIMMMKNGKRFLFWCASSFQRAPYPELWRKLDHCEREESHRISAGIFQQTELIKAIKIILSHHCNDVKAQKCVCVELFSLISVVTWKALLPCVRRKWDKVSRGLLPFSLDEADSPSRDLNVVCTQYVEIRKLLMPQREKIESERMPRRWWCLHKT